MCFACFQLSAQPFNGHYYDNVTSDAEKIRGTIYDMENFTRNIRLDGTQTDYHQDSHNEAHNGSINEPPHHHGNNNEPQHHGNNEPHHGSNHEPDLRHGSATVEESEEIHRRMDYMYWQGTTSSFHIKNQIEFIMMRRLSQFIENNSVSGAPYGLSRFEVEEIITELQNLLNEVINYENNPNYIVEFDQMARIEKGQTFQSGSRVLAFRENRLEFQPDGNLVLYGHNNQVLFTSHTQNRGASLHFQGDGNLVIIDRNGRPIWDTHTHNRGAKYLLLKNDGQLSVNNAIGEVIKELR